MGGSVLSTTELLGLPDELATDYKDIVCFSGKTGAELVQSWRDVKETAELLTPRPSWPRRQIEAKTIEKQPSIMGFTAIPIVGPRGPYFENWVLQLDYRREFIVARDNQGEERWKLPECG